MIIQELESKRLAHPPKWLADNCAYLTITGSVSYGISTDTSDFDVYGFAIPPKSFVFPHLAGYIEGFDPNIPRFEQWVQHHIRDPQALGGKGRSYDFSVFGIVRYFALLMENNPNVLDSLFTPLDCVIHVTHVGTAVRDARKKFLHKGAYHKFRGYAFSQLHKVEIKERGTQKVLDFEREHRIEHRTTFAEVNDEIVRREKAGPTQGRALSELDDATLKLYHKLYADGIGESGRFENVKIHGWDTKFMTHVFRLLDEAEQILTTGDLDIRRSKDFLKAVRRGEVKPDEAKRYFDEKEKYLQKLYEESSLPHKADLPTIKQLLLNCLESHYGTLDNCVVTEDAATIALREMAEVIRKHSRAIGI